jgi:hypothetical protein
MRLRITFFFFLLIIPFLADAQRITKFSEEKEAFIKELTDFFSSSKKEGKKFIEKDFAEIFLAESYPMAYQQQVVKTCNELLDQKHPAYPAFESYILAIMAFQTSGKDDQTFREWHSVINKLTTDKRAKKYVPEFLANSASLYKDQVFFSTNAVQWKFKSMNYQFVYDSIPKIRYPAGDLICYSKGDSSVIKETSGEFHPFTERWIGTKGKVTWDRADFDPATTYAVFENYEIRIKGSSFLVDSVLFYNEFFEQPLLGQLNEKVLANRTGDDAAYPRFESYNQRLEIKNLLQNVDYEGGFTMRGNKLAGTGTREEPAKLTFFRDDMPFLISQSLEFAIRPEKITSQHAEAMFFIDKDTISHPDLNLKFDRADRRLTLLRTDEGLSKAPYRNTYHEVDMYFEALYWNIDDPLIELGSLVGSTQHLAAFESKDYYKKARYDGMMGIAMTHPLVEIRDYTRYASSRVFYSSELASFLRLSNQQTMIMLIDLNNQGFVNFNLDNEWVEVNQKLFDYLKNNSGARDYDVLLFNSEVGGGNNAQLNLLNYNLLVKGVQRIQLSDSQNVNIYPAREEVILKKDRDFKCGGRVKAGNFEFMGKEYYFDYETFKIDLINVDSCRIYVEDETSSVDAYGRKSMKRVKNVLEDIAGTLKIDAPTNKSGVQSENYPQYPIFSCTKESYVYYDNSRIQGGVYDRDRFYYQIEPYVIDSLDNFSKEDLSFKGTLVSSDIFPDIKEPLVLMDDDALGFDMNTGGGGLPAYVGKGKFTAEVKLNYTGLQGKGALDYLTSKSYSDQFIFFPDSTKGRTTSFENLEERGQPGVPKSKAQEVDIAFYPQKDLLRATTIKERIQFFRDEAQLTGSLYLQPEGMTGRGDMDFEGATLSSKKFRYDPRKILADTAEFKLAQEGLDNLAFRTDNVSAEIDFDERAGDFKSNGGETKIDFPANQYICFMDEFKWFMDKNEMELSSNRQATEDFVIDTSEDKNYSNFFSVNELQDSLNFLAPKAIYDIKESVILCDRIKFIAVADSKVLPDSGRVVVRKRAKMDPLSKATLISNYVTQYHRIFNAEMQINGKFDYEGEGDIAYVDGNKMEQIIHLNKIEVDTTKQTIGRGKIPEEDGFMLSPFFAFSGDFELAANEKNLTFEGGTQIMHACESLSRNWFKFRAPIDPQDIYIPVDTNMRDLGMAKLGAGVMIASEAPVNLYSSFLSRKNNREDVALITATGFLRYDPNTKRYLIGSKDKIKQPRLPGNLVQLNTDDCSIVADGQLNYDVDYGHVKTISYGDLQHNTINGETTINGVFALDFFFDESLMKYMTEQLQEWPSLQAMDISKTNYEKSIKEIMGLEESDKVISELNLTGQLKKLPQELQRTFYFADVTFKWDDVEESFISEGPIGIASIGKKQIFRYVKGKIELQRSRSADILRIYLQLDGENWYFFEYKLGLMNITASDKEFNVIVTELKDDKRKTKDEEGNKFALQLVASKKKRNDFVDRFREFD